MGEPKQKNSNTLAGTILVVTGTLILGALVAFVTIALGFRNSFTSSLPPIGDMVEGLALLSPIVLLVLLLIGYGRRLLRKI